MADSFSPTLFDRKQYLSPSSSSARRWTYDIFLNFRGEDTRRSFVGHLYKALNQKPLNTFIDSVEVGKGKDLSVLLKAIQESRLSVLVFSQNYASSTWCLKELVQIMQCLDHDKMIVVPIFYEVDPSDIRKQTGNFETHFVRHELNPNIDAQEVRSWRSALTRATNLSGWDSATYQDDVKLIEDIVEDILKQLMHVSASKTDDLVQLVGMDSHLNVMEPLLCTSIVNDVRIVGIWGMGGIGKSTIAKAVYDKIKIDFEHSCFLDNVKEGFLTKNGAVHMKVELLSRILKVDVRHILDRGSDMLRERLGKKKVLLVLDDVDSIDQIETLIGKKPSFGSGSRIIITTRDKHLLGGFLIYEPKALGYDKALDLFRQYAFITNEYSVPYYHLSSCAVKYAQGLPLALKVLGALLDNKSVSEWEDELEKIKKIPDRGIEGVLKTSIDGLDESQKNIFLDVACFFRGKKKDYVTQVLDNCGFHPCSGLRVLIDRALITISHSEKLEMHDLLQKIGWEMGKVSRLRSYEHVERVINQNTGTEAVEGIILELKKSEGLYLNANAFVSMKN